MSTAITSRLGAVNLAALSCVLISCGAEDQRTSSAPGDPPEAPEAVDSVAEAVSLPSDICGMVNTIASSLKDLGGGSITITGNPCKVTHGWEKGYSGSIPTLGDPWDLFSTPVVTTSPYLCAIADAGGAVAKATLNGGLGKFGVESTFQVTKRDAAAGVVEARRVAKFFAFGIGANFGVQDIKWKIGSELSGGQVNRASYKSVDVTSAEWNIDASVQFQLGAALMTIAPDLRVQNPFDSLTNGAVELGSESGPLLAAMVPDARHPLDLAYNYADWLFCQNHDTAGCISKRDKRMSTISPEVFQVEHLMACGSGALDNYTDGQVPYRGKFGGASCAGQNYVHFNLMNNWFHFGRPNSPSPAPWEKTYSLSSATDPANTTVFARLVITAEILTPFGIFRVETTPNIASRDGFSVSQIHTKDPDERRIPYHVDFQTSLSAQTQAALFVSFRFNPFFGPAMSTAFTIDLGNTGNKAPTFSNPWVTQANSWDSDTTSWSNYTVKGQQKADPEGERLTCLSAPKSTPATPTGLTNPSGWLRQVADAAANAIHPCNVKKCEPSTRIQTDLKWDNANHGLVLDSSVPGNGTTQACNICYAYQYDICDAAGNIVAGKSKIQVGDELDPPQHRCIR